MSTSKTIFSCLKFSVGVTSSAASHSLLHHNGVRKKLLLGGKIKPSFNICVYCNALVTSMEQSVGFDQREMCQKLYGFYELK